MQQAKAPSYGNPLSSSYGPHITIKTGEARATLAPILAPAVTTLPQGLRPSPEGAKVLPPTKEMSIYSDDFGRSATYKDNAMSLDLVRKNYHRSRNSKTLSLEQVWLYLSVNDALPFAPPGCPVKFILQLSV